MRKRSKPVSFRAASIIAAAMLLSDPADAHDLCPKPHRGLKSGDMNVDAQLIAFEDSSQLYPIEVYSGFAARGAGANVGYCLRYEAENKGSGNIAWFYWKTPDFKFSSFPPRKRASVVFTSQPGLPPVLKPTTVHAFKSASKSTVAYQPAEARADANPSSVLKPSVLLAGSQQKIDLPSGQSLNLSDVGTRFELSDIVISVESFGYWDGNESFTFGMSIKRSDPALAKDLISPYAYAIAKASDDIPAMVAMAQATANIPFASDAKEIVVKKTVATKARDGVQIIAHPVVFTTSFGQICITARSYAPAGYQLSGGCEDRFSGSNK